MTDLKELKALLKLLRENGVLTYKTADISLSLSPESHIAPKNKRGDKSVQEIEVDPNDPWRHFPAGELSPEQLMYYSAGGMPGEELEEEGVPQ